MYILLLLYLSINTGPLPFCSRAALHGYLYLAKTHTSKSQP